MATNTMNDVDRADAGETKDDVSKENDPKDNDPSENPELRERLMRALAEVENSRRQGERRAQEAGNMPSRILHGNCCWSSTICAAPSTPRLTAPRRHNPTD